MHSKGYKLAKKYYPTFWDKAALERLVEAGKLYDWEFEEITGEPYNPAN